MSEATGLSIVIEAKNALAVFTQPDHIESILQQVEKEVNSFVPDVCNGQLKPDTDLGTLL